MKDQDLRRNDFEWLNEVPHPHEARRKAILKVHPEIKTLMNHDPNFKWIVTAMVLFQFLSVPVVAHFPWWLIVIGGYCIGGVINHSLTLAIHEIAHAAPFGHGHPRLNNWFGFFASLPIGVPIAPGFKKYHLEHHKYQGVDTKDPDLPTRVEAILFSSMPGKCLWLFLQPLFYVLRPLLVDPKTPSPFEVINFVLQAIFNASIVYFFGWKPLVYLLGGGILAMGFHPMAAHFIAEHYMYAKGFETYSYYGPWNYITFNVGYHNEHHDFPNIPHSKLPKIKEMASEFYKDLPQHHSWTMVIWDWITDPAIGPYTRVKRELALLEEAKKAETPEWQLTGKGKTDGCIYGGYLERRNRNNNRENEDGKTD
ncbi:unnamed protein product [Cyprideis torosa]|uniref:sphingolipid 4-desaturase n=1 Tax=Cyprideis torosa TaxID=163714 RepID=A0A7R8ZK10_9CRUS|nr:unnamed protein product [Cyprideis torosa]CAG0880755.1 unnamed protein product [Cyprideis torosa]